MYTPKINPFSNTHQAQFKASVTSPQASQGMAFLNDPQKASFQDVLGNLTKETERTLNLPDELMNRALTTGDVDMHEVMIANTKADLAVNIASQVVTKIIQAYERVQQIQV